MSRDSTAANGKTQREAAKENNSGFGLVFGHHKHWSPRCFLSHIWTETNRDESKRPHLSEFCGQWRWAPSRCGFRGTWNQLGSGWGDAVLLALSSSFQHAAPAVVWRGLKAWGDGGGSHGLLTTVGEDSQEFTQKIGQRSLLFMD